MPEMIFQHVEEVGDCLFAGLFRHPGLAGNAQRLFRLKLRVECGKPFFSFLPFVDDCEVEEVSDLPQIQGFVDEDTTPDTHYWLDLKRVSMTEKANCVILKYKWRMWIGAFLLPVVDASIRESLPLVDGTGEIALQPDKSGEFEIRVCCNKTEEGCTHTCQLL